MKVEPYWSKEDASISIYQGDCINVMTELLAQHPEGVADMIFADPPYFLSNGGITCNAGKMVSVHKGKWDKSRGVTKNHEFNLSWLALCQSLLKPNGTIWVSGTNHVIFSVGYAMQQLGYKILNDITWEKPNPPPNLSCRFFTHATETVIWAAKNAKSKHVFHYQEMKKENGGKQMKSVWRFTPPLKAEKVFGKHPTQKPLSLVRRCLRAASNRGDIVLDPFLGSGTSLIAALEYGRRCVGIEIDKSYCDLAIAKIKMRSNIEQ